MRPDLAASIGTFKTTTKKTAIFVFTANAFSIVKQTICVFRLYSNEYSISADCRNLKRPSNTARRDEMSIIIRSSTGEKEVNKNKKRLTDAVLREIGRYVHVVDVHGRSCVQEHGSVDAGVVEEVESVRLNGLGSGVSVRNAIAKRV